MPKVFYKYKNWVVLACILTVSLFLCSNSYFFDGLKCALIETFTTPFKITNNVTRHFQDKDLVLKENIDLRKKAADLSLALASLEDIRSENERLRDLLKFRKKFKFNTVSAEIIGRDPYNWSGSFIIDRGAVDGIKPHAAVCSSKGLLGKVIKVNPNSSIVVFLTNPGFKAGGVIKENRLNGIIVGAGKGMAKMTYIPIDSTAKNGDTVITSGLSRIFPKGILVGKIVSVHKNRSGLYKFAVIKPFAELNNIEEVLCVLDK